MARSNPKPPKRGRPPLPPGQARKSQGISLTEEEREHLWRLARRCGKSLSEFIRDHLPLPSAR